ncbi:FAD-binding oxidoreductase [Nocardioides aestuarii]|uniref:FAD-binding oxidoreductase n=1 Tax=Nocardioides aestuarii TaxID=252231 RepID=A0ABW4TIZ2_9ACTN
MTEAADDARVTGLRRHPVRTAVAALLLVLVLVAGLHAEQYTGAPEVGQECAAKEQLAPAPEQREPRVSEAYPRWLTQVRGTVNDASCLGATPVYGVARPQDLDDVRRALAFARRHDLVVVASGTRHAMGGQNVAPGALVLDMRGLTAVAVDAGRRTATVGAGALWRDVLEGAHAERLAVSAMPSIDSLSVGGTLSVNAHGADFRAGSLASSVRSLTVVTADGEVHRVSRTEEPDLFRAAIGGYGLVGVIVEAELDLVPNRMYDLRQTTVATADLADHLREQVFTDPTARLTYAHLSTSPGSLLEEAVVYTHREVAGYPVSDIPALRAEQDSRWGRLVLNLARHGGVAQRAKWALQRDLLPRVRQCHESRNEALRAGEACLVSRTQAMYNDLGLLRNNMTSYTDVLQEYFLEPDQLAPFLAAARTSLERHDAELLNASVRVVHDSDVVLDYARGDRLSVVLYLSQDVSAAGNADMESLCRELVAASLERGGTFYLPYQQHYTRAQVAQAYPMLDRFFALKRRYDPEGRFRNSFYDRFA